MYIQTQAYNDNIIGKKKLITYVYLVMKTSVRRQTKRIIGMD